MASVGNLVTDEQVLSIFPNYSEIPAGSALYALIPLVEDLILSECDRDIVQTAYTDEVHSIPDHMIWHDMLVKAVKMFQVKHPPVDISQTYSLKIVVSRGSDGTPSSTTTVDKSKYYVDSTTGVVTMLKSPYNSSEDATDVLSHLFGVGALPQGIGTVLFSYTGGYSTVPRRLSLAVLAELSRYHSLFGSSLMHVQSQSGEFGFSKYMREGLSPEARDILRDFKMPITV